MTEDRSAARPDAPGTPEETEKPRVKAAGRGSLGATEDQVNMTRTVPQRIDPKGSKVEDLAGTGTHDAQGG